MSKIITLGEIMLRLATYDNYRLFQEDKLQATFGGAEANVAISLSHFGHDVDYITKVPDNSIGRGAINSLQNHGVNTKNIAKGGSRLGVYYLEPGAAMRPSKVIYDRAGSSMAEAEPHDFDFDKIFENADIFHWSGITPAISENCAEIIELACICAKKHGVTVSCDLNYRNKLWTPERAFAVMKPLMKYVDICFGIDLYFGFRPDKVERTGENGTDEYSNILKKIQKEYGFKLILTTVRDSFSATHNALKALVFDGKDIYASKTYDINPIIDRVGGGDAFAAGFLHGYLSFGDTGRALEFATAAAALKHTIHGDANIISESEVVEITSGDVSGKVQR